MSIPGAFPGLPFHSSFYRAHRPVLRLPVVETHDIAKIPKADVVVVLAHPDDETFITGTLKKLTESGYSVQLVYATSGDAGKNLLGRKALRDHAPLGSVREKELRRALKSLKITRPLVMLRWPDGTATTNAGAIRWDIDAVLQIAKPKLVISFGPDGMTGHPDHISIGRATSDAAANQSVPNYRMALSPQAMELADIDWPLTGTREEIDVRVNIKDEQRARSRAMKKHTTQFTLKEVAQLKAWYMRYPCEEFVRDEITHKITE